MTYGRLAQLVEHLLDVQEVTGSSPVPSTTSPQTKKVWGLFSWWRYRTRTARPRRRRGNKHPSGVFVSARFPTRRNVYQERCRQTHSSRVFLFWWTVQDENRAAAHSAVSKATVRLCLARGSQRLGMSTKKDADHSVWGFFCGGRYRTRTGTSKGRVSP